jgi:hypothetical protein
VLLVCYSVCYLITRLNSRRDLTTLHIKVVTTRCSAANYLTVVSRWVGSSRAERHIQRHTGRESGEDREHKQVKKNSVAFVREQTISTERPPLVGEVSANTSSDRGVPRGHRDGSILPYSRLSKPEPLLFLPSTREAEWSPFQIHYFSENLVAPGIESGPLDL